MDLLAYMEHLQLILKEFDNVTTFLNNLLI